MHGSVRARKAKSWRQRQNVDFFLMLYGVKLINFSKNIQISKKSGNLTFTEGPNHLPNTIHRGALVLKTFCRCDGIGISGGTNYQPMLKSRAIEFSVVLPKKL